jgi:hypothetical protein
MRVCGYLAMALNGREQEVGMICYLDMGTWIPPEEEHFFLASGIFLLSTM